MKALLLLLVTFLRCKQCLLVAAFVPSPLVLQQQQRLHPGGTLSNLLQGRSSNAAKATPITSLKMALDLVTYLRTEWISAALCKIEEYSSRS
jgi:hypothetical protein